MFLRVWYKNLCGFSMLLLEIFSNSHKYPTLAILRLNYLYHIYIYQYHINIYIIYMIYK